MATSKRIPSIPTHPHESFEESREVSPILFNEEINQTNLNALLEQYKLYIASANLTSSLRSQANTFFLTIHTALISFLTGLLATSGKGNISLWPIFTCLAGILLGISWLYTLRSYRALNSGRFAVINEIESKLPARIYAREWELVTGRMPNRRKYIRQTYVEQTIPLAFAVVYLAFILTLILL